MSNSDSRIDLVSGAEVPAEEIVVTPAMIEAATCLDSAYVIPGHWPPEYKRQLVARVYRAMEYARRAEIVADICECGDPRCELGGAAGRAADTEMIQRAEQAISAPPPGYRSASEDELERTADNAVSRRPTIEELEVFLCPTGQKFSAYISWPGDCGDGDGSHD